ncbi:MAG: hypothetical protein H6563_09410 [Lewinellaceae bacterium]|nr:hypothetical protein [Lewinellaceae bacterium]
MRPWLPFLFLLLPYYLFSQDTLLLQSGEKKPFDRLYRTPYHFEYEWGGARYYLPRSDFDKIIRKLPKNEYSLFLFYGFGGIGGELFGAIWGWSPLPVPQGEYPESDWGTNSVIGGLQLQWGHRWKNRTMLGALGGVESYGSPFSEDWWERHTDQHIVLSISNYAHYIHFALSPFYRMYFLRNNLYLQTGPYVGILKYSISTFYRNYNTIKVVDELYSDRKEFVDFHPGIQVGAGWALAYGGGDALCLEVQWHIGFGPQVAAVRYGGKVMVNGGDLSAMQMQFGVKYSIR